MTQHKEIKGDWEDKANVVEEKLSIENRDWNPAVTNGATLEQRHDADAHYEATGKPRDYEVERKENHAVIVTPGGQFIDKTEHIKITDESHVTLHKRT